MSTSAPALIRGRRFGKTHRRGWIVRRALLAADVVGLVLAFVLAEVLLGDDGVTNDKVGAWAEFVGFLVTIPMWLVLARLLGLYESDEEHADHTTVDDATGCSACHGGRLAPHRARLGDEGGASGWTRIWPGGGGAGVAGAGRPVSRI